MAHVHSIFHYEEIAQSVFCGCFYCLRVFTREEIVEWTDEDSSKGKTALCSYCNIDSVLGDKSGLPISDKGFLEEMHSYWF